MLNFLLFLAIVIIVMKIAIFIVRFQRTIFFLWIGKPYFWIIPMVVLGFGMMLLAKINNTMFNIMSFSFITVPLFCSMNEKFYDSQKQHRANKLGFYAYYLSGIIAWVLFFGHIVDTKALL